MTSSITDRLYGAIFGDAMHAPVLVASTGNNLTLSGAQTIDGISVVEGDRVLVKDQSSGPSNGIYLAATSSWQRTKDADGTRDLADGHMVYSRRGAANGGKVFILSSTAAPVTPGTDSQSWAVSSVLSVSSAVTVSSFVSGSGLLTSTSTAAMRTVMRAADRLITRVGSTGGITLASSDHGYLFDSTADGSAGANFTLPASTDAGNGYWVRFKNSSPNSNSFALIPTGSAKIDGSTETMRVWQGYSAELQCDGANWHFTQFGGAPGFGQPLYFASAYSTASQTLKAINSGQFLGADASTADQTITLPPCSTSQVLIYALQRLDAVSSNAVYVSAASTGSTDLIQGATSIQLMSQYDSVTLVESANSAPNGWLITSDRRVSVSSSQTVSSSATITYPHKLNGIPSLYTASLKCIASTGGFSTGQEFLVASNAGPGSSGIGLAADQTNVLLIQGATLGVFSTTGGRMSVNSTSWVWVIRARS